MGLRDPHQRQTRLVLFRTVAHEAWPYVSAGDQVFQRGQHLTAIANAQGKCPLAREKGGELLTRPCVEQNGFGPALAGAHHIAIRKTTATHESVKPP